MKPIASLLLTCIPGLTAHAQIEFTAADVPQVVGEHQRAYFHRDADVAGMLGSPGGPQQWDFSHPQSSTDIIQRVDIVAPADIPQGTNFPAATFSERLSHEGNAPHSWSYYSVSNGVGRVYHGFYETLGNPDAPLKVFHSPTVDLPVPIQFGQTWTRTVDFDDRIEDPFEIEFAVHFTADAVVDGHGTLDLPGIGTVPALRVNEVHTYQLTDVTFGLFHQLYYIRNYYWLVPGIGKAVDISSQAESTVPPENFTTAGHVLRVFEASGVNNEPSPGPIGDVRIRIADDSVLLDWEHATNAASYCILTLTNLSSTNWLNRAETTNNSWSEPLNLNNPQRLYRVLANP